MTGNTSSSTVVLHGLKYSALPPSLYTTPASHVHLRSSPRRLLIHTHNHPAHPIYYHTLLLPTHASSSLPPQLTTPHFTSPLISSPLLSTPLLTTPHHITPPKRTRQYPLACLYDTTAFLSKIKMERPTHTHSFPHSHIPPVAIPSRQKDTKKRAHY